MNQKDFMKAAKKSEINITTIANTYKQSGGTLALETGDGKDKSLLDYAAISGNMNLLIWLALNNVAMSRQHNSNQKTPLHYAIAKGQLDAAFLLILVGADVSALAREVSVFKPPGHTKPELNEKINNLIALCHELSNLVANPQNRKLSEFRLIQQYAPNTLGKLREVNNITESIPFDDLQQRYPMLGYIDQLVQADATAAQQANEIIEHIPPAATSIQTGRNSTHANIPTLALNDNEKQLKAHHKDKMCKTRNHAAPAYTFTVSILFIHC